jgi:hypothetical protein
MEARSPEFMSLEGTGSTLPAYHDVDYVLGDYVVRVRLTSANEFVGILKVTIGRDFRSQEQRLAPLGYHDVTDLYDE